MSEPVIDLRATLLRTLPTLEELLHQGRLLDAIGAARTDAEFAVAWQRWYFDEGER